MPTTRTRKRRTPIGGIETLSESQRHVLLTGRDYFGDAFRNEDECRAAWDRHREKLIEYWQQDLEEWKKTNKQGHGTPIPGGPESFPWGYSQFDEHDK